MQRFRALGDPREFGDWIVGVVPLPAHDRAGFAGALRAITAATEDMALFMLLPDGNEAVHYTLRFSSDSEPDVLIHEREFWPLAVEFKELRPLIVEYIEQVNRPGDARRWQDEYHPRGSFAIAELALADVRACALLGRLLFQWDMGHETYQEGLIDQLFEKHGMVDQTLDLLASRVLADGQAVGEQIAAAMYDHDFRRRFDLEGFANRCASKVQDSDCPEIGLEQFAMIYADGDEIAYDAAWAAFTAAGIGELPQDFDADESCAKAEARSSRPTGHWDQEFLQSSVEDFGIDALEQLDN